MLKLVTTLLLVGLLFVNSNAQTCTLSCQNGGVCVSLGGTQSACACPTPFTGDLCQTNAAVTTTAAPAAAYQINQAACSPACSNGGVCLVFGGSLTYCACPSPWTGPRCTVLQTTTPAPSSCATMSCLNGGVCITISGTAACACAGA